MTLDLATQYNYAMVQQDFRHKVCAASFTAAVAAFSAPPITGSPQQAQRLALANQIVRDASYALTQFAWVVVSRPALVKIDDLTDAFITSTVAATFDIVAQQIMTAGP